MTIHKPRVVILGAGFGGIWAARRLAGQPIDVLLIDKNNYHTFLPLLYQVAAAELEPERIAQPVRQLFREQDNLTFMLGTVSEVNPSAQQVVVDEEIIDYDYLIVALGSTTSFFGVPGAAENCFTLKSVEEAVNLRNHILTQLEAATREPDIEKRKEMLTFTIVGGGPTGVEYAGALAELLYQPLEKDFKELNLRSIARVILLEAGDQLLRGIDEQAYAVKRLQKIGVEVLPNSLVSSVEANRVLLKDAEPIPTQTTVWAAGVRGIPILDRAGFEIDRGGQIHVRPSLQSDLYDNLYIVGDLMRFNIGEGEQPLPNTAQVAMQSGEVAADNIKHSLSGTPLISFEYRDKGVMATIGRNSAVANIGGRQYNGFLAWLLWLFIHLFFLIGFRNRLGTLTNWAWNYILYERVVRLIMPAREEERELVNG